MSAFEKLPRETRDQIYEHCLLYDGVIDPFPNKEEHPYNYGAPTLRDIERSIREIKNEPCVAREIQNKPCVALLGVNSKIRDEAASTLFGKNTWRLSFGTVLQDKKYRWWETYAQYFRHLVTSFDDRDADEIKLLDLYMEEQIIKRAFEDSDHFNPAGTADIHQRQLSIMKDGFIAKKNILLQMELKTLSIELRDLFCPSQCCRREALQTLLIHLGSTGPWYRLEQERGRDRDSKPRTDIKLLGLEDDKERKFFWDTWGLMAD